MNKSQLLKEPDVDFKGIGTQFIVIFKRKYLEESEEKVGERVGEKVEETLTQNKN